MHDLIVKNARLYLMSTDASASNATSFAVDNGLISELDPTGPAREIVDVGGRVVLPGFVDCHTHALYAGERRHEHSLRLRGASYEDIARAGGGIRSTVAAVREASEDELVEQTMGRLAALKREGVTAIEIKSGYGLSTETELKMLRAIRRVAAESGVHVTATFLGAHRGARRHQQTEIPFRDHRHDASVDRGGASGQHG